MLLRTLILFVALKLSEGAVWPEGLTRCHKSNPDFDGCLKEAIEAGMGFLEGGYKPLGIPVLDPINIEMLKLEGAGAGTGGLSQTFKNVKLYGISKSKFNTLHFDQENLKLRFNAMTPRTEMLADYELKGQVLIFPIDSSGRCNVTLTDIAADHETIFERVQKNGKTYLSVKQWTIQNMRPKTVHYDFDNIIPGNPQIGQQVLAAINENALEIFEEILPSFEKAFAQLHKIVAKKVFDRFPENEIYLD